MPEASSPTQRSKKAYGGWLFLLAVLLAYALISYWNPAYGSASLRQFLQMARDLAPILLLVFLFLWLLELGRGLNDKLAQLAGHDSGLKGWIVSIGGGILSHGPVYAWYPLLQNLQTSGVRPALIATFLYARSIKLPYLPLMAHYFGLSYMLVLTFYIALFSIVNGWLVEKLLPRSPQ